MRTCRAQPYSGLLRGEADANDSKKMFLADRDGDYLGGRLKHERGERKGRRFEDAALDGALNRSEIVMRHRLIKTQDVIVNKCERRPNRSYKQRRPKVTCTCTEQSRESLEQ